MQSLPFSVFGFVSLNILIKPEKADAITVF